MEVKNKVNSFAASDWFDISFFGNFVHSESENKKRVAEQILRVNDERLSSRVLNHWYEVGILEDDRPNGKGWKKFSLSELVWIQIIIKLRSFGLDLSRIKNVKRDIDIFNSIDKVSKCSLLDFYIMIAANSNIPIKFIVFESGETHIVRQIDIDIANTLGLIKEDFISIDLNKLLNRLLKKKKIEADYLNLSTTHNSPILEQVEKSLSKEDIKSLTIKVKNTEYVVNEKFLIEDKAKAKALMNVMQFASLFQDKNAGKSTYLFTKKKKIKKG